MINSWIASIVHGRRSGLMSEYEGLFACQVLPHYCLPLDHIKALLLSLKDFEVWQ
jgi:hypothetical protein